MTSTPNGDRPALPLLGLLKTVRTAGAPAWLPAPTRTPTPAPSAETSAPAAPVLTDAEHQARRERELAEVKSRVEQQTRGQLRTEHEQLKVRYLEAIRALSEAAQEIGETYSAKTIELALVIARDVLGRELSFDRAALTARIAEALSAIGSEPAVRVRVGTADAAYLVGHPDVMKPGIELVEDPSLSPGACFVESSRRVVDASIEVRLSIVRDILAEVATIPDPADDEETGAPHAH